MHSPTRMFQSGLALNIGTGPVDIHNPANVARIEQPFKHSSAHYSGMRDAKYSDRLVTLVRCWRAVSCRCRWQRTGTCVGGWRCHAARVYGRVVDANDAVARYGSNAGHRFRTYRMAADTSDLRDSFPCDVGSRCSKSANSRRASLSHRLMLVGWFAVDLGLH